MAASAERKTLMSLLRTGVHAGLWTTGIRYGFFLVNFSASLWLARLLAPNHFGLFVLAMSFTEILFFVANFGIVLACLNLQDEPEAFDTGMTLTLILSAGMLVLSLGAALLVRRFYDSDLAIFVLVLSAAKSLFMIATVYAGYLDLKHQFKTSAFVSGVGRPFGILAALAMAHAGFEAWSLLAREALAIGLAGALAVILSPYRFRPRFDRRVARRIWSFAVGIFFMRMVDTLHSRLPQMLMGSLAGTAVLGLYDRSLYLASMSNTLLEQLYGKIAFTLFSKVKARPEKIAYGLEWNMFFASRMSFVVGLAALMFPELVITTALGAQWSDGADFLQGFGLMIALLPSILAIRHGLMVLEGTWLVTRLRVVAVAIALAGIGIGWFTGHWSALAWAMSAESVLSLALLARGSRRFGLHLKLGWALGVPALLAVALAAAIVLAGWRETGVGLGAVLLAWGLAVLAVDGSRTLDFVRRVRSA